MSLQKVGNCVIFAGCYQDLALPDESLKRVNELTICADGGLLPCFQAGMRADIAIGDFDSADKADVERALSEGTKIFEHPVDKDETDMDLALKLAFRMGVRSCHIFGALGGRLDHELVNVMMMRRYASMGMRITLNGRANSVHILTHDFPCSFKGMKGRRVSLIPLSDVVAGINTSGMSFELHGEDLASGSSRGVSNRIISDICDARCSAGEAAVVFSE